MHHIGQCHAGVLIISARWQFPPGAPIAGSLIYIKTKGMVGYAVSGWISPTYQGNSLWCGSALHESFIGKYVFVVVGLMHYTPDVWTEYKVHIFNTVYWNEAGDYMISFAGHVCYLHAIK